jgi:hypothetical protein
MWMMLPFFHQHLSTVCGVVASWCGAVYISNKLIFHNIIIISHVIVVSIIITVQAGRFHFVFGFIFLNLTKKAEASEAFFGLTNWKNKVLAQNLKFLI